MASRYKPLLKDTVIFGLGNLGKKLILLLMVPLYTNFMSDAEYGIAELVFTAAQLMAPFISVVSTAGTSTVEAMPLGVFIKAERHSFGHPCPWLAVQQPNSGSRPYKLALSWLVV